MENRWNQKCPVCDGRGIVQCGFYFVPVGQTFTSSNAAPETCRTCNGKGIIIQPEPGYYTLENRFKPLEIKK